MGNRMICGFRRRPVEERLTRPQRLLRQSSDVDYKRLRKLILSHKLAPCFDAVDADDLVCRDLEECPICFLYFPSLNRSRCCAKGICTECFLQMKPSVAAHPAQCPFCKTPCYAVEYRGARTEEEKCLEQVEEQKFIEAKIRMQSESEHVCHAMPIDATQFSEVRYPISSLGEALNGLGDSRDIANARTPQMGESLEGDGYSSINMCSTRHEEFAVDLEGIMMMEAIWQSLQDTKLQNGSTDTVGSESGKQGSNNISPCSASSGEGECSLHGSLAECSIPRHQISEIECGRCSTYQRPHRVLFEESEPKCFASSYISETIDPCFASSYISETIDPGSNCSINFASTVDSLLHVNGGRQRRSRYSSLVIREQPYMVDTESMA